MSKKSWNTNLRKANKVKNDEFYTQLSDIERELGHYEEYFKWKTILCNCDDPRVSNFWHYFTKKFKSLGLKKVIATCYKNQNINLFSSNNSEKAVYMEYFGDTNTNNIIDSSEINVIDLQGDGDFRSTECIELLKQADIVVTNPPFSLFREYVAQLIEYDKDFVIIGNQNAITYKETFKLIKENKVWVWNTFPKEFQEPDGNIKKFWNICWFTNLDYRKRYQDIILYKKYNEIDYIQYYNYDAINIDKVKDIPLDYSWFMWVPITFLSNYNPNQFEIIGLGISSSGIEIGVRPYTDEHKKYRKEIQKRGAVDGDLYIMKDGVVEVPYARILIKNKKL